MWGKEGLCGVRLLCLTNLVSSSCYLAIDQLITVKDAGFGTKERETFS